MRHTIEFDDKKQAAWISFMDGDGEVYRREYVDLSLLPEEGVNVVLVDLLRTDTGVLVGTLDAAAPTGGFAVH